MGASPERVPPHLPVKFAVLGCGNIGSRHAQHIAANPRAQLVAAYDLIADRAAETCSRFGGRPASSLADLLDSESDIVNVCTPNGVHCEGAVASLRRGKHVLVEKPMALTTRECESMIQTAAQHGRQLFVVKQNRFNPPVRVLKELVETGRLGRIFAVQTNCYWSRDERYYTSSSWRGTRTLDGGTLFTQFSHFVDILYYLFGDFTGISGILANLAHEGLIEFEDTGFFTFRFATGALGAFSYTTAAFARNMEGSLTVFAENGTIKVGGHYLNKIEYYSLRDMALPLLPESSPPNDYGAYQGSMSNHDKVIANVIETLAGNESIVTSAAEGAKVVEIIERMYGAARSHARPDPV